jgi:hypothetical protein
MLTSTGTALVVVSIGMGILVLLNIFEWRDGINVVALVLSVGGLWIGIYQISHASRVVDAASQAVDTTRRTMVSAQQVDLLHRARAIESRLDQGVQQRNVGLMHSAFSDWRQTASELHGLAESIDQTGTLERRLRDSTVVVRKVSEGLRSFGPDPVRLGNQALERVSAVCDDLSRRIGLLKGRVGNERDSG